MEAIMELKVLNSTGLITKLLSAIFLLMWLQKNYCGVMQSKTKERQNAI